MVDPRLALILFPLLSAAPGSVGALLPAWSPSGGPADHPDEQVRQAAPMQVGVRPARVRVGDTFVVTVRLVGPGWPEVLDVEGVEGAEVVDVKDRSSAALGRQGTNVVVERDFVLRALRPGAVAPSSVFASWGADTLRSVVPPVEAVGSPVAWTRPGNAPGRRNPERGDPSVRDQGLPPTATGRDADRQRAPEGLYPPVLPGVPGDRVAWPGGGLQDVMSPFGGRPVGSYPPYGSLVGGSPYAPTGWGVAPPGRGWAPSAAGDPWWPELVPRLEAYETQAQDPMGMVRLEAGLTPRRVYQGQQVTLVATATFAPEALARLGTTPEFFPPSAGDAWSVEIPYAPPTPAALGGRVQQAHTFMRAFFPVRAGAMTVEPTRLTYAVGSGGSAARPQDELVTEPLTVEVMPVPDRDAPPGWQGAVGRYRVAAWVQPNVVAWGEAALLTIEVAGAGNIRDLPRPDPGEVWGAELRPTGERAYVEVRDGVIGGVKTFSWLVVPVEAGGLRIGPVIYSYFDPWMGAFGQVASGELLLEAHPFPGGSAASGWTNETYRGEPGWTPAAYGGKSGSLWSGGAGAGGPGTADGVAATDGDAATGGDIGPVGSRALRGSVSAPGPEARALALLTRTRSHPGDGDAWAALARTYREGRPGDGWAEWATLSGARFDPRHPGLGKGAGVPGLPTIPLTPGESLLAAILGVGGGLGMAGVALQGPARGPRRRVRAVLGLMAALSGGVLLEPWLVLHKGGAVGVVVDGPAALRRWPTQQADGLGSVPPGTPVQVEERYGGWVRVKGGGAWGDGDEGWVEEARLAMLPASVRRPAPGEPGR